MRLSSLSPVALAGSLAIVGMSAQAADFTFSGNVSLNTDIVQISFTLNNDATNVAVWTDSFGGGINYDPITALWRKVGNDYELIDENDDDDTIRPATQTYFDSGFTIDSITAGDYLFTVGAFPNFAYGTLLSQGFAWTSDTPQPTLPIADWCQPASQNCTDQKGTFWRVNLSGVDGASGPVSAVPEPETYALMLAGLGLVGFMARRRRVD
jgi:hypothetical protein